MFTEYLDQLQANGKRYFTFNQAVCEMKISIDAAKSAIYRMRNEGKIISPAKGLYVIVPPEHHNQGSIPAEELTPILMKYLNINYYVALLSAAAFHGAAHQKSSKFQIITNKRIKHPLKFGQIKIDVIYKKYIDNLPVEDFVVSTGYLKIASPELIAYDILNYQKKSGGLNHIATVFSELVEALDSEKLIKLAKQINEKSWLQRLGYILERIDSMDEDKVLNLIAELQKYLSHEKLFYVSLASEIPHTGFPRIKKWKIIENTNIESDL